MKKRITTDTITKPLAAAVQAGLLVLLFTATQVFGQVEREIAIGAMHYYTNEALTEDDIQWPDGQPYTDQSMLENYGVIIGVKHHWTDEAGVEHNAKVAQVAENKFSDIVNVTPPVEGAFTRTFRNPYPQLIVDGRVWNWPFQLSDPVDPSIPADAQIYHHLNTWTGIDIQRWTYAFGAQKYDDFIIIEYLFTNRSGEPREDVYFGITSALNSNVFYPGDLWGNYIGATYANYVENNDPTADSMRAWVSWDANETSGSPNIDDRGNPDGTWGHLAEPQSMAHVVLHADTSPKNESDDPHQPSKAGWSYRELSPDLNVSTHEDIYSFLSDGWDPKVPGKGYSQVVNEDGEVGSFGNDNYKYRQLTPRVFDYEENVPKPALEETEPGLEQSKTALFSFGPYDMAPGDNIRIVMAIAGGQIPHHLAIAAGRAYDNGFAGLRNQRPIPFTVTDLEGNIIYNRNENRMLTREEKNAILNMSIQLALKNADQVVEIWKDPGTTVAAGEGEFGIPLAPASPSLTVASENAQISIQWGNEAEQDAASSPKVAEVVAYRVYRNYWRPPAIARPTDTSFVMLAEIEKGTEAFAQHEYVDKNVIVGEQYFYYVTAVSADGLESSAFQNRMGRVADPDDQAAVPTRPANTEGWQDEVVVVPNPYHAQALQKYDGRRLNFLNLPAYANIHIYTIAGDLVQTLHHVSNTADEDWERQATFSNMEIVSGVYLYVVEELDASGNPTGETAIGKFVVIK